jgi:hypothetical protein
MDGAFEKKQEKNKQFLPWAQNTQYAAELCSYSRCRVARKQCHRGGGLPNRFSLGRTQKQQMFSGKDVQEANQWES